MEKINIELYQELKEIAEDSVKYYFNAVNRNQGSRLCLVDINFEAKPFIFDNLGEIEKFQINYPYVIFRVNYKKENNDELCFAVEVKE